VKSFGVFSRLQPFMRENTMDDNATLTISEFCETEKISRATYYYLRALGRGPAEIAFGKVRRISHEARREWRESMEREPIIGGLREAVLRQRAARSSQAA
jgi:hypothetical protein